MATHSGSGPRRHEAHPLDVLGPKWLSLCTLETMLTHPLLFGLTKASKLQRAVCRVSEGTPIAELWDDEGVRGAFNGVCPIERPGELAIVGPARAGKTLVAAADTALSCFRCDVSELGPGDEPKASVVSARRGNAFALYRHLGGRVMASPILSRQLLSSPEKTSGKFDVRHPTGKPIHVEVVAPSPAGVNLTSFWLASCKLDEYARMTGEGAINWKDQRGAAVQRILPGGSFWHITSAWAPFGPAYEHVKQRWGSPGPDLCVVRGTAWQWWPEHYTEEVLATARLDAETYRTDILGEFANREESLFADDELDACVRPDGDDIPPGPRCSYIAAMDPATRSNGWTLVIAMKDGDRRDVVLVREWKAPKGGSLDPDVVLKDIGKLLRLYRCDNVASDQYSRDALNALAKRHGFRLVPYTLTQAEKTTRYLRMKTMIALGQFGLPRHVMLLGDLLRLQKIATATGIRIHEPLTADGRHCDFAPSLMLIATRSADDVKALPPSDDERARMEEAANLEKAVRAYMRESGQEDDDE